MKDIEPNLHKFIELSPLTTKNYSGLNNASIKGQTLFLGIGGGRKLLTRGVPFDVLVMLITAEEIKQTFKLKRGIILLADEVTRINNFDHERIDKVTKYEFYLFEALIDFLDLENWEVVLQSSYNSTRKYEYLYNLYYKKVEEALTLNRQDFMNTIAKREQFNNAYKSKKRRRFAIAKNIPHFALELADIDYLLQKRGVKIGWQIEGSKEMDEEIPNVVYEYCATKSNVNFIYTKPGVRVTSIHKPNVLEKDIPYICYFPNTRILFHPDENVKQKFEIASKNPEVYSHIKKYYNNILREYKNITKRELTGPVWERVQWVIDELFEKYPQLREELPPFFDSGTSIELIKNGKIQ